MIALDVNVLVYGHRVEMPDHERYAELITDMATGEAAFGCSELALNGFVRVVTNPKVFKTPTSVDGAARFCEALLARPNCVRLRPGPRHFEIFLDLCRKTGAQGKLVADAYHAALAIENGCEWVTTDSDFSRFPGLRSRHPLAAH